MAGRLGPLERRIHRAQTLGVSTPTNIPPFHRLTGALQASVASTTTTGMSSRPVLFYFIARSEVHVAQTLAGLGRLVANKFLKFPRGSNRSSYTQLYVGFFLSGLLHASGDFVVEKRVVYRPLNFFLLQAVAITFEDFVIYISKGLFRRGGIEMKQGKEGGSWLGVVVRIIGYCWVILWFCLALPAWVDGSNTVGLNSLARAPLTQFLLDRWKQWA